MGIETIKLIKDKRGIVIKNAFYAVLIFSALIIASGVIIVDWYNQYGVNTPGSLEEYNTLQTVYGDIQSQEEKITPNDPSSGDLSFESNTYRGVYGILTSVLTSFKLVTAEGGMIDSISNRFGIPSYVSQLIIAMILISLITGIAAVIFRLARSAT
jgi:hypothetical protein